MNIPVKMGDKIGEFSATQHYTDTSSIEFKSALDASGKPQLTIERMNEGSLIYRMVVSSDGTINVKDRTMNDTVSKNPEMASKLIGTWEKGLDLLTLTDAEQTQLGKGADAAMKFHDEHKISKLEARVQQQVAEAKALFDAGCKDDALVICKPQAQEAGRSGPG